MQKLIRHSLVAGLCFLIEFTLFSFLYHYTFNIVFSQFVSVFISVLIGYFGHTYFTHRLCKFSSKNLALYFTQAFIMFILSLFLLYYFIDVLHLSSKSSKLLQMLIVFPINFLFGTFITFGKSR